VPSGSGAKFVAQVTGNPAAAIHEVWITYTGAAGGTWASVDLQQCIGTPLPAICGTTADSQYWMGESASVPDKYIAQAANGVGLVTLDDNLGSYYSFGAAAPSATSVAFVGSVPGSGRVRQQPRHHGTAEDGERWTAARQARHDWRWRVVAQRRDGWSRQCDVVRPRVGRARQLPDHGVVRRRCR